MDELVTTLSPPEFHKQFLSKDLRADGRCFDDFRPAAVQANVISKANGSAMIRQSDALIIASVGAELGRPRPGTNDRGRIELKMEQSATKWDFVDESRLSFGDLRFCSDSIQALLDNGSIVDLKDLCIEKGKLCWILRCDVVILDGTSSIDGCLTAVCAALNSAMLPEVTLKPQDQIDLTPFSEDGEKLDDDDDKDEAIFTSERIRVDLEKRRPLKLADTRPVASTFLTYRSIDKNLESDSILLADPSLDEVKALGVDGKIGLATVMVGENGSICGLNIAGGGSIIDDGVFDRCLSLAEARCRLINLLIVEACAK